MRGERPHSADEIHPELQDLEAGDVIPDSVMPRGIKRRAERPGPA
jgi:hypothetical protein